MGRIKEIKRGKSYRRKKVYLIICEGRNKTETLYFEHFKKRNNEYILKIEGSESTDPISMVETTKHYIAKYDLSNNEENKIFCLIDIDDDENKAKLVNKLKNQNKNIQFITSNSNFETWYLLHFVDSPKPMNSSNTVKKLKRYIPTYNKSYDVYLKVKEIKSNTKIALTRAETLRKHYKDINKDLTYANPYTMVDNIVEILV